MTLLLKEVFNQVVYMYWTIGLLTEQVYSVCVIVCFFVLVQFLVPSGYAIVNVVSSCSVL